VRVRVLARRANSDAGNGVTLLSGLVAGTWQGVREEMSRRPALLVIYQSGNPSSCIHHASYWFGTKERSGHGHMPTAEVPWTLNLALCVYASSHTSGLYPE
jgi:hypothetical protein